MNEETENLKAWDRRHVWHGFTQMAEYRPLVISRAEGCFLTDIDGREFLDGVSSLWCNVHGHNHPRLNAALHRQIDLVSHVTSLGMSCDTTVRFAHQLAQILPAGLERIFFSDSGSTAVEVAVKMALQYWQQRPDSRPRKTRYAAFDLAYHGDTVTGVSLGGISRFHEIFRPLLFQPVRLPVPLPQQACGTVRNDSQQKTIDSRPESSGTHPAGMVMEHHGPQYWCGWRPARARAVGCPVAYSSDELASVCASTLREIESLFREHHEELAAVVVEPLLQGAGGMLLHPPGFLRGLSQLATQYDILMVFDEVAVGMGRTGKMFACEHEGVIPDFLCLAKGISGGYLPLAVTATHAEIWSAFQGAFSESKTFFHGHTYGGNALACAVGLESLKIFSEENTLSNMQAAMERLKFHLGEIAKLPGVGEVRQIGLIGAVELVRDQQTCEVPRWEERYGQRVCDHALQHGVWLRPLGNVVVIMPPLTISAEQIDRICHAISEGIRSLSTDLVLSLA
jgi:adenosylmethionine---8-amino-7-oxononanoate aminotransferase